MKHKNTKAAVPSVLLLLFLVLPGFSQQDDEFYGDFLFGYRYVDARGTLSKYKEDFNLFDGVRLFHFDIHYQPQDEGKLFDRLDMYANNLGGDPYETLSISLQKYGAFRFKYNRRKSTYFYNDTRTAGGQIYDLHSFDFDRVRDSGSLEVKLHNWVDFVLGFDRYSKQGESVTTFDINRVEFEFDKPIQEDYQQVSLGLNIRPHSRYSFLLEEKIMDYENKNSLFLPGYADGGSSSFYPSALKYFHLNQPYEIDSNLHSLKVNAHPLDNLILKGTAQLRYQDLDLDYSESASGTDYLNRLFSYILAGNGSFERNIQLYDMELTYLLMNKLAVVGAVRYHNFEQEGTFTYDGESEISSLGYDTVGFDGGLQYQFSPTLSLTAGYRSEYREFQGTETVNHEEKTSRNGFFGNLNLKLNKLIRLTADYQHGIYDNPFTLISPTDFYRFRVKARLHYKKFSLNTSYMRNQTTSDILEKLWESQTDRIHIRAGYRTGSVKISTGYTWINVLHETDRIVFFPPSVPGSGSFAWDIFYEGRSNLLDASLDYDINEQIKIGAYGNYYNNNGSWEISRTMGKGFVEYMLSNGLVSHLGYRYIDFREESSVTNDYSAHIIELSFGYRWE